MPSKHRVWVGILEEYLEDCRRRQLGAETIQGYRSALMDNFERLEEARRNTHPKRVTRDDAAWLLANLSGAPPRRKWRTTVLNTYLMYNGNPVVKQLGLYFPTYERPNADWLELEQIMVVKASTENSLERMIIYLGADLGLRKVEIKRQKMGDIDLRKRTLDVLHKGRCGGKPGRNPIHELTPLIYGEYMDWRQKQILDVKQGNPDAKDPGTLIIEIDRDKVRPASDYYQEDSHRRLQTLWDILS